MIIYAENTNLFKCAHLSCSPCGWSLNRFCRSLAFEQLRCRVRSMGFESHGIRDSQLHFRPTANSAQDLKLGANSLGSFPHSGQAPMPVASRLEYPGINPAAIVTD